MKYNELQNKTAAELIEQNQKLREELFHLRLKNTTAQLEKKNNINEVRRDIARIQTKLSEIKNQAVKA